MTRHDDTASREGLNTPSRFLTPTEVLAIPVLSLILGLGTGCKLARGRSA